MNKPVYRLGKKLNKHNGSGKEIRKNLEEAFTNFKWRLVSNLFWGRSNYHKNLSHFLVIAITFAAMLTGIVFRVSQVTQSNNKVLSASSINNGTDDLLQQGGSINTVLVQESPSLNITTRKHKVKEGETLNQIAENYNIDVKTIQWASSRDYSELFFSPNIQPGWELTIPDINGVIHTVQEGETIDSIIAKYSTDNNEANRFNVIEFNNLAPPYELEENFQLFIPDGNLVELPDGRIDDIPRNVFTNPLANPGCQSYGISRGFTWYHNGVDLARGGGCPISAVADGVVVYAGWASQGQGYMTRINHGGGIVTEYFHGNGEYYVKQGERVQQGQKIMYMGCTGYCTGTHLHLILWKDGIARDPAPYIPY